MKEYSKAHFPSNYCWDDELFTYKENDDLEDVWKDIDKVNINIKNMNANILNMILSININFS